jgi:hypothetical protein
MKVTFVYGGAKSRNKCKTYFQLAPPAWSNIYLWVPVDPISIECSVVSIDCLVVDVHYGVPKLYKSTIVPTQEKSTIHTLGSFSERLAFSYPVFFLHANE